MTVDYQKVVPQVIPVKRGRPATQRNPFNCLPATYTANLSNEAYNTSQRFRDKIARDKGDFLKKIENKDI